MCYQNNKITESAINTSVFNIKLNLLTLTNSKHALQSCNETAFLPYNL